jgi:hypothetical protein
MALEESETYLLSIQDLNTMRQEFYQQYEELFQNSFIHLKKALIIKLKAMKICAENSERQDDSGNKNTNLLPTGFTQNLNKSPSGQRTKE